MFPKDDNCFLNSLTEFGSAFVLFPYLSFEEPSYSIWNLTFSHKNTCPSLELFTWLWTYGPTQSFKNVTFFPINLSKSGMIGCNEYLGLGFPLGLPRCERMTNDLGPSFRISCMVGIVPE